MYVLSSITYSIDIHLKLSDIIIIGHCCGCVQHFRKFDPTLGVGQGIGQDRTNDTIGVYHVENDILFIRLGLNVALTHQNRSWKT